MSDKLAGKFINIAIADMGNIIKVHGLQEELSAFNTSSEINKHFAKSLNYRLMDRSNPAVEGYIAKHDRLLTEAINQFHRRGVDAELPAITIKSEAIEQAGVDTDAGNLEDLISAILDNALEKAKREVETPSSSRAKPEGTRKDWRTEEMRQAAAEFAGANPFTFGK